MVTRFVVNYYILPIDANPSARQNVVITTFCNVTTFWVATTGVFRKSIVRLLALSIRNLYDYKTKDMLMCLHVKVLHYDFNIKININIHFRWTGQTKMWSSEHASFLSIQDGLTSRTELFQQLVVIIVGVLWAIGENGNVVHEVCLVQMTYFDYKSRLSHFHHSTEATTNLCTGKWPISPILVF